MFFAATVVAFSALTAQASEPSLNDFCKHPYEVVCGGQGEAEAEREAKVQAIKDRLVERAKAATRGKHHSHDEQLRAFLHELGRELGGARQAAHFQFERIRRQLAPAVKNLAKVAPDEARAMLENLKNVRMVDALELLEGVGDDAALIEDIRKDCGEDGMTDNAFAFTHENQKFVVLCPGAAIAALGPGDGALDPSELALSGVIWLLGHETGHHIDSSEHPITYEKLKACFDTNYAHKLAAPVESYMSEISADYWGSEQLAAHLDTLASPREKLRALQEGLQFLCGSEDDKLHPSGRFRIETLVRRNPRLHEAARCEWPSEGEGLPSCTLRGQWRRMFW